MLLPADPYTACTGYQLVELIKRGSPQSLDFSESRSSHCKILGVDDLDAMLASGAHWARKFDLAQDAKVMEFLDRQVEPL